MNALRHTLIAALGSTALFTIACASAGTAGSPGTTTVAAPDPLNAAYRIERETITLANGRAEREVAPGSAAKAVTTLSGQRVTADVDGDGRPDVVVILVHYPGGSGTFYYIAALLNTAGGVTTTPAVLLGDRIKVDALRIDVRAIAVDLLDRAAGQPLSASPTIAKTRRFVVDNGTLIAQ